MTLKFGWKVKLIAVRLSLFSFSPYLFSFSMFSFYFPCVIFFFNLMELTFGILPFDWPDVLWIINYSSSSWYFPQFIQSAFSSKLGSFKLPYIDVYSIFGWQKYQRGWDIWLTLIWIKKFRIDWSLILFAGAAKPMYPERARVWSICVPQLMTVWVD